MKIEWTEDLSSGTNERTTWAIRGMAGDVAVERRSDVTLNTSTRRLENMRLEVLDGIRAGLGLPQDAIREEDIVGVAAAMGALRRMAEEALLLEAEQHNERLMGLTLEFATARHAAQEEPDTIEAVIAEWEARGGIVGGSGGDRFRTFVTGGDEEWVASWDTLDPRSPIRDTDEGWRRGTLNDLRVILGLKVKP